MWVPVLLLVAASDSRCADMAISAMNGLTCTPNADWEDEVFRNLNGTVCEDEVKRGISTDIEYVESTSNLECINAFLEYRNLTDYTCNCTSDYAFLGGEGGLRPGVVVVAIETIMRLFLGLAGPVLGAFIDRTDKRKTWMKRFYVILICATSMMTILSSGYVWIAAAVAFGVTGIFDKWTEEVLQTYLPYISSTEKEHANLGSKFQLWSFNTQVGFLVVLMVLQIVLGATLGAIVGSVLTSITLALAGMFWISKLPPLPGRKGCENQSVYQVFSELLKEIKAMRKDAPEAAKYLFVAVFSLLGVVNVVTLSGTFFVEHVKMNSIQNGLSYVCALVAGALTMLIALYSGIMAKYRLRTIYIAVISVFTVIMACGVVVVTEEAFVEAYILSFFVGGTLSIIGAVDWPMFCLLIPVGKEATYRGVYSCVRNLFGFIGPGIYTLVVQETNNHALGFAQVVFWNVCLLVSLYFIDVDKAMKDNGTFVERKSIIQGTSMTTKIAPIDEEEAVEN
jgi:MFS-type transporter involved in bile tolerance (Atg22 family)